MGVLTEQASELLAVGRTEDERFARILTGDLGHDARFGPREASVGRNRLERHQRSLVGAAGTAMVETEGAAILQADDAAEGHHAGEVERRHFSPGLTFVLAHDAWHARAAAFAEGGREDPQAGFASRVDDAIEARAVLVGREAFGQLRIESRPGQATVVAPSHRAGGATVIDAPDREDRLAVRHQQCRRMALVKRRRARGHDHLACLLPREVDHREVWLLFGREQRGQAEQDGKQGAHGDLSRELHGPAKPVWSVNRSYRPGVSCRINVG